ncbi:hypothetical protein [Riemerella columbina]|uniref:hypothetical protein n=1 Tax=Riemerella columbina TaxID=103810 RepID=UPI00035E6322|nr:hypothetical protein [Riemerella columbina]
MDNKRVFKVDNGDKLLCELCKVESLERGMEVIIQTQDSFLYREFVSVENDNIILKTMENKPGKVSNKTQLYRVIEKI